ncbi:peptidase M75 superfamily protein [Bizionia argentinensis JUB59]|uniref:Peptidase M75 superfamily protein n=1 Tax=Bizionia argentinensis JUB59 TaxID=1046627 RepID=G2EAW8_9FLAO|nr:imelysin family protein [Bizionia argentinensis]EGV44332.1 peptidase M75 superfamily protein [Bizionia argentinensis JUB59]
MIKKIISIFIIIASIVSCSSSDDAGSGSGNSVDGFNRQSMLTNWADNIIIPVFQDLNTQLADLVTSKNSFIAAPNQTNLEAFRASWLKAYKVWQYAEMFNIGEAEAINYYSKMNIYPTSVPEIESNIASGTYNLSHPNNQDAVGFPALDYLLYGVANNDMDILSIYTTNVNAENYKNYLSDLVNEMKTLTNSVLNNWTTIYRGQFVSSTANTATSSTNKLTNDFIFYYEKGLRANKIGIPAGVFSTNPLPKKVEAYYKSDVSKELTLVALDAVQDFFNGKAYNSNETDASFKQYLQYLNSVRNGEDLDVLINNQINLARSKVVDLNPNFTEQITTNNAEMTNAYNELQKVVVLIKVDMVQSMNISVDYVDADGD